MVSRRVICRSAEAGGLSGAFPHRRWGRGRSGSSGPLERLSAGDNVRESGNLTKPEPELSKEAQEALAGAVAGAKELRIEPLDQECNPI